MTLTANSFAISLHVVTAILGLGQAAGIAVVASSTLSHPPAARGTRTTLERLARGTSWSLAVMVLSGLAIARLVGWDYYGAKWWLRISFIATLVLGAITGGVRRTLRKRDDLGEERALRSISRSAWIMCAITSTIAILMELKPW